MFVEANFNHKNRSIFHQLFLGNIHSLTLNRSCSYCLLILWLIYGHVYGGTDGSITISPWAAFIAFSSGHYKLALLWELLRPRADWQANIAMVDEWFRTWMSFRWILNTTWQTFWYCFSFNWLRCSFFSVARFCGWLCILGYWFI